MNPKRASTLSELGFTETQITLIRFALSGSPGLIGIFGAVGSGKSSTLRAMLAEGACSDPRVFDRLEDHDPACLLVDLQAGHRCFTVNHGSDAINGLFRLWRGAQICRGIHQMPPLSLAGPKILSASIYQRLLSVLCPKCKLPASHPRHGIKASKQELLRNRYKLDTGTMFVANPSGCEHCKSVSRVPGLFGITVVAEILILDHEIHSAISRDEWHTVHSLWRNQRRAGFGEADMRGKTAFEAALYKVAQGSISLHAVEEEFQPIENYEIHPLKDAELVSEEDV